MSGKKKKGSEKATPSIYGRRSPDTKGTRSRRCWSWTPARLQGDARRRCGGAARRLQPGGRAHRKTRPDAEPHREGTRREARRPAGLAQRQNGRGGPTVRLSLERGARLRAENGPRTYRTHIHRSFNWGNGAPGVHGGRGGVRLAPRVRTICAVCSAEIGNQPRMVHTASRTPQQT